jgi:hypothetical protein
MSKMMVAAAAMAAALLLPAAGHAAKKHTPVEKACAAAWKQCVSDSGCGGGRLCSFYCEDEYRRCLGGRVAAPMQRAAPAGVKAKPASTPKPAGR